jgi:sec-independent protein translocase protein TatA
MWGIGGWEIAIILLVVLIIFGPSKLPQMGKAMGQAIREFKKAGKELRSEVENTTNTNDDKDAKKDNT